MYESSITADEPHIIPSILDIIILFPAQKRRGGPCGGYALIFPLFVMISCMVALPFHLFLEMPCIRLGRRIQFRDATCRKAATAKEEVEAPGDGNSGSKISKSEL